MRKTVALAALLAGLVGPASATTVLDFTADDAVGGSAGGTTYTVSAIGGTLVNTTHWNDNNCVGFDCRSVGSRFDVGFGVDGPASPPLENPSEVDATVAATEYVMVKFDAFVKILGFAGMLTYNDSKSVENTETVMLEYSLDGGETWLGTNLYQAPALNDDNDEDDIGDNQFGTVGLAVYTFLPGFEVIANAVRFTANGTGTFDNGNTDITVAGLTVAPVPVPASLPLLLAGLGALGFAARRKQRKSA
jgi:hypothetical protein